MSELVNIFLQIITLVFILWLALGALSLRWKVFRPLFRGYASAVKLCLVAVVSLMPKLPGLVLRRHSKNKQITSEHSHSKDTWH